ncbi:MAG: hypothetical protein ACLSB7_07820 [Parabacteroides distasonis]
MVKANGRAITPTGTHNDSRLRRYPDHDRGYHRIHPRITDNKSRIRSSGGTLYIDTSVPLDVSITTMAGKLIRHSPTRR